MKYMYGASTNAATLTDITIMAVDASQLSNEYIGLRLRVNNVNVTVRLPAYLSHPCSSPTAAGSE